MRHTSKQCHGGHNSSMVHVQRMLRCAYDSLHRILCSFVTQLTAAKRASKPSCASSRNRRGRRDPVTPDRTTGCSKRTFDGMVRIAHTRESCCCCRAAAPQVERSPRSAWRLNVAIRPAITTILNCKFLSTQHLATATLKAKLEHGFQVLAGEEVAAGAAPVGPRGGRAGAATGHLAAAAAGPLARHRRCWI